MHTYLGLDLRNGMNLCLNPFGNTVARETHTSYQGNTALCTPVPVHVRPNCLCEIPASFSFSNCVRVKVSAKSLPSTNPEGSTVVSDHGCMCWCTYSAHMRLQIHMSYHCPTHLRGKKNIIAAYWYIIMKTYLHKYMPFYVHAIPYCIIPTTPRNIIPHAHALPFHDTHNTHMHTHMNTHIPYIPVLCEMHTMHT